MRRRAMQLLLLMFAAAGGVVWWQRRNETPPTPPDGAVPSRLRPAEPFMDPVLDRSDVPPRDIPPPAGTPPLPGPPRDTFTTAPDDPPDDLRRITGVGPKIAARLNEEGITTFAQLAALSEEDVDRLQEVLQFPGRIRRDRWVEQAARLSAER